MELVEQADKKELERLAQHHSLEELRQEEVTGRVEPSLPKPMAAPDLGKNKTSQEEEKLIDDVADPEEDPSIMIPIGNVDKYQYKSISK